MHGAATADNLTGPPSHHIMCQGTTGTTPHIPQSHLTQEYCTNYQSLSLFHTPYKNTSTLALSRSPENAPIPLSHVSQRLLCPVLLNLQGGRQWR